MSNKAKHLTLLKAMYDPKSTVEELQAVKYGTTAPQMSETEQVEFNEFAHKVGNIYLQVMEELDDGLTKLADQFPAETDPRKWHAGEWITFHQAVEGHKYADFYITYAKQEDNLHLVWAEIETRL